MYFQQGLLRLNIGISLFPGWDFKLIQVGAESCMGVNYFFLTLEIGKFLSLGFLKICLCYHSRIGSLGIQLAPLNNRKHRFFFSIPILFLSTSSLAYSLVKIHPLTHFWSWNGTWSFKTDPYNLGLEDEWFQNNSAQGFHLGQVGSFRVIGIWEWNMHINVGQLWYQRNWKSHWTGMENIQNTISMQFSHDATVWINKN